MPTVRVGSQSKTIEYEQGTTLLDIMLEGGVLVDNPCNGKGTCGKCRVKMLSGELPAPTENEKKLLSLMQFVLWQEESLLMEISPSYL